MPSNTLRAEASCTLQTLLCNILSGLHVAIAILRFPMSVILQTRWMCQQSLAGSLTCVTPSSEWGIGKQGSCQGLEGKTNAHLFHHVLFILEIDVDLRMQIMSAIVLCQYESLLSRAPRDTPPL